MLRGNTKYVLTITWKIREYLLLEFRARTYEHMNRIHKQFYTLLKSLKINKKIKIKVAEFGNK